MSITRRITGERLRTVGLDLLRVVHVWTGRQYRRGVIRRELRRIGRQMAAERRARQRAENVALRRLKGGIRRFGSWCRGKTTSHAI